MEKYKCNQSTWNGFRWIPCDFVCILHLFDKKNLDFTRVKPDLFIVHTHIDGWVLERRNCSVLAMELHLSCTNPSTGFMARALEMGTIGYPVILCAYHTWFDLHVYIITSGYPSAIVATIYKVCAWIGSSITWHIISDRHSWCSWGWVGLWGSCGGHHRPRGKTTTGSALDGAVFDIAQILGVWPFWLTPFFQSITFCRVYGYIVFPLLKLLSFFWLTYYCSIGLFFSVRV